MSERLRVEDQLRESEERFRQVTENIREVWLTTSDKNQLPEIVSRLFGPGAVRGTTP